MKNDLPVSLSPERCKVGTWLFRVGRDYTYFSLHCFGLVWAAMLNMLNCVTIGSPVRLACWYPYEHCRGGRDLYAQFGCQKLHSSRVRRWEVVIVFIRLVYIKTDINVLALWEGKNMNAIYPSIKNEADYFCIYWIFNIIFFTKMHLKFTLFFRTLFVCYVDYKIC